MAEMTIYHNPRCGKSRTTLELIRNHGVEPSIIEYLKDIPSEADIKSLLEKLGIGPQELLRKGESIFKEKYKGKEFSDKEWISILHSNPILIERPIVIKGNKAVLGRPPENVEKLF